MTRPKTNIKAAAQTPQSRLRRLGRKDKKNAVKSRPLPSALRITLIALKHLWQHKRVFLAVYAVYVILYVLLVRGLALDFKLGEARTILQESGGDELGSLGLAGGLFDELLSTGSAPSSEAAGVYQLILFVMMSLVIIWLLRGTYERRSDTGIKQAFYQSSYPLVPYVLVGLVLLIQSLPALLSLSIYSLITANGIALGAWEQAFWLIVVAGGVVLSSYFLSASLFASYIVTLPNTTPLQALRSAKQLVRFRRLAVIRKVLFLPFLAIIFLALVFMPLVLVMPLVAELLFMLISLLGLFVMHAYFYILYRKLL